MKTENIITLLVVVVLAVAPIVAIGYEMVIHGDNSGAIMQALGVVVLTLAITITLKDDK